MTTNSKRGKQVSWKIAESLRKLVQLKADLRQQHIDEYVAEVLEANTQDVKQTQQHYVREKQSSMKGIIVLSAHESKAKGSR